MYIADVSWWQSQSLRVDAFEFWDARGPSGLAKDWFVRLHCRPMWNACFLFMGCSVLDYEVLCSDVSR